MEEKTAKKENLVNGLNVCRNIKVIQGILERVEDRLIFGGYTDSQEKTVERFISSVLKLFCDLEDALYPLETYVEDFKNNLQKTNDRDL